MIVVINKDDTSKNVWEDICSINQSIIDNIEYISNEENYQFERNMYLDFLRTGKKVFIEETEIKNEQDLDKALQKYRTEWIN